MSASDKQLCDKLRRLARMIEDRELAVQHVNTEAVLADVVRGLLAELADLAELEQVSELTDLEGGGVHFGLRLLSAFNLKGANR